jgi:prephenate dehydratase/prephenate dehydrogenase
MVTIATLGPVESQSWQAAKQYQPDADIQLYTRVPEAIGAFEQGRADLAIIPIYNTREGEVKDVRVLEDLKRGFWVNNIVLPIQLSLGCLDESSELTIITGTTAILKQCEEFISQTYPDAGVMVVQDLTKTIAEIKGNALKNHAIIETEPILKSNNFSVRHREVAPHNRTRFAIIGPTMNKASGYDATALVTVPLTDRVGILYDILGEFSQRGINLLDLHTENDLKTQKLQIYLEAEGHIDDGPIAAVIKRLEHTIIQESNSIKILGSYPRVDMRTKHIKKFGFIGTGAMSKWFADRLENEGYKTVICGRNTELQPEKMIPQVDVVIICVPISATAPTIRQFGSLLAGNQALILLAGEAEDSIATALHCTNKDVEVMLVHNLWGPQAAAMKDKNAAVVRTPRSGPLCSEFEAFLYKHGAEIFQDTPIKHDLLMGVSQKLPSAISIALAMALKDNQIRPEDIASHSTLTSLYCILAMARLHAQNPRTYAEIMAAKGEGNKMLSNFQENLQSVIKMGLNGDIDGLYKTIEQSRDYLSSEFLDARMEQSLAIDQTLGKMLQR